MDCSTPGLSVPYHLPKFAKFIFVASVMLSSLLILWCPLLLLPQSFPASGSFLMSRLFTPGGQSIGASASASLLPMNLQDWFPLGLLVWSPYCPRDSQDLLQHHSLKASIFWCSASFMVQLSHSYMTTGKTIALTIWIFVSKVMSLFFSILPRFVIDFLPRSKGLLISWLKSPWGACFLSPRCTLSHCTITWQSGGSSGISSSSYFWGTNPIMETPPSWPCLNPVTSQRLYLYSRD